MRVDVPAVTGAGKGRAAFAIALGVMLSACDTGTEQRASVASTRAVQRSYVPSPPGTVPRGTAAREAALSPPGPEVTPALLARGGERFRAFCTPCHGMGGHGDGPVVSRGFPAPPSYHREPLLALPAEGIVTVISHGKGRMFSYADRVPPQDRWAIAHYVKALQAQEAGPAPGRSPTVP